jgi:galactokinase
MHTLENYVNACLLRHFTPKHTHTLACAFNVVCHLRINHQPRRAVVNDIVLVSQARAVHVFSEASRVLRFRNICSSSDSPALKHVTLGGLMRKSHESLREKYDCSCAELEELMVHCKRLGALGSRLTGAGWGGASVHLVRTENVRIPFPFYPLCCCVVSFLQYSQDSLIRTKMDHHFDFAKTRVRINKLIPHTQRLK